MGRAWCGSRGAPFGRNQLVVCERSWWHCLSVWHLIPTSLAVVFRLLAGTIPIGFVFTSIALFCRFGREVDPEPSVRQKLVDWSTYTLGGRRCTMPALLSEFSFGQLSGTCIWRVGTCVSTDQRRFSIVWSWRGKNRNTDRSWAAYYLAFLGHEPLNDPSGRQYGNNSGRIRPIRIFLGGAIL